MNVRHGFFWMALLMALIVSTWGCRGTALSQEDRLATAVVSTLQAQGVTVLPAGGNTDTGESGMPSSTAAAAGPGGDVSPNTPTGPTSNTPPPTMAPLPTVPPGPTALPTPTPQPTPTPTPGVTQIEGRVCYPSASIPEMTVYIQPVGEDQVYEIPIAPGQTAYQAEVPPGQYYVYAWLPDFSKSGSYSQAVTCGLTAECKNHTLLPVVVEAGQTVSGVDVCDWYHGPFDVPYPPNVDVAQATGAIRGNLSYPSDHIPPLQVVAFILDTKFWYWVGTAERQNWYTIEDLPPGRYHVVAYLYGEDLAGGYTADVVHHNGDHTLLEVIVRSGQTTTGIDPVDWYAPPGTFPPNPAK